MHNLNYNRTYLALFNISDDKITAFQNSLFKAIRLLNYVHLLLVQDIFNTEKLREVIAEVKDMLSKLEDELQDIEQKLPG